MPACINGGDRESKHTDWVGTSASAKLGRRMPRRGAKKTQYCLEWSSLGKPISAPARAVRGNRQETAEPGFVGRTFTSGDSVRREAAAQRRPGVWVSAARSRLAISSPHW